MKKINYRILEKKDFELLKFWFLDPLILKKSEYKIGNKKQFYNFLNKLIKQKRIFIIISDNIRIGFYIFFSKTKLFYFSPQYFFFNYIDYNNLKKINIIPKSFSKIDVLKYYSKLNKKNDIKNINISTSHHKKNSFNKKVGNILILGPKLRNKNIIKFLENKGLNIVIKQSALKINDKILNNIDLVLSNGYAYKIDKKIINKFKNRIINLHATFLPWGKGIGTTLFSFLFSEPTGISLHIIDQNFDTGKIISRKLISPKINDTIRVFYKNLINEMDNYLIKSWNKIKFLNFLSHNQNKIYKNEINYFSRLEFEKLISCMPKGYDVKILDLCIGSFIIRSNEKAIKLLNNSYQKHIK